MVQDTYFYKTITHSASETAKKLWFYIHSVGWFACRPTYDITRDHFFGFQMKYVLNGKGKVNWKGRNYDVKKGDLFFLDLTQPHRYSADPDDPFILLWVHFDGVRTEDYFHLLEGSANPIFQLEQPEKVQQHFWDLYTMFEVRQVGQEAIASSILTNIMTDMIVFKMKGGSHNQTLETPAYPTLIEEAIYYMESYFDKELKLEHIANQVSLSPYHFTRIFKKATGYSVMEYLQKFRINHAKILLTNKDMSIGEISDTCGFTDQSYFGKLFKRYENLTPKQYRKANKNHSIENVRQPSSL